MLAFMAQLFDAKKGINIVGCAQLFIINPKGLIIKMLAWLNFLLYLY